MEMLDTSRALSSFACRQLRSQYGGISPKHPIVMFTRTTRVLIAGLAVFTLVGLSACATEEAPADDAMEAAEESMEAADESMEAAEEATEEAGDAMEAAEEATEEAAE